MRRCRWLVALAVLLLGTAAAGAADLTKVERTLVKEPAYQTKSPRYCLLVFGPEAKFKVWLVQDGDVLYVDRNGNGDLTEEGERVTAKEGTPGFRVFEGGELHDGSLTHTKLSVSQRKVSRDEVRQAGEFARITKANPEPWIWAVGVTAARPPEAEDGLPRQVGYIANGDGLGYLLFADRPQDAPVIHFNGPWMLGLQDINQHIQRGQPVMLQIGVGTHGVGPGTFSFVLYPGLIPDKAYPVAEITFPPKAPGEAGPRRTVTLTKRC
jgi:hypothetical protein